MSDFEWQDTPPSVDGDYFYSGPLPDGPEVVAIVQIFTMPETGERQACIMIPPGWRGDKTRDRMTVYHGTFDKWKGRWAGPEYGLCAATYP